VDWFNYVSLLQWKVSNHEVSLLCIKSLGFCYVHRNWRIKPVYEVVGWLQNKCISVLMHVLMNSFPQSMIVQLVLNLLESRDIIAVLQWSIAFDAFPLWHS